jgi:hypothetical protein
VAAGNAIPPRLKRGAVAPQFHAHAVGEPDLVREAMARYRDHHRNISVERAFDQIGETLAIALPLSEAVDDEKVGTGCERVGDTGARVLKPCELLAQASKSCASGIVSPLWTSTADRLESAHLADAVELAAQRPVRFAWVVVIPPIYGTIPTL